MKITVSGENKQEEHVHQDIELLYILEGTMDLNIDDKTIALKNEDIFVINSNKKHSFIASDAILIADVPISYQLVSHVCNGVNGRILCDSRKEDNQNYAELRITLKKLLMNMEMYDDKNVDFEYISHYFHMIELLTVHFLMNVSKNEQNVPENKVNERRKLIDSYVQANYNQAIGLKDLSEQLYLSMGYLSRYFKQNYGLSFTEYLMGIRLYYAVDELLYTDKPITRIALDNGFSSVSFFNRAFKKAYGKTPSSFRKQEQRLLEERKQEQISAGVTGRLERYLKEGADESVLPDTCKKKQSSV